MNEDILINLGVTAGMAPYLLPSPQPRLMNQGILINLGATAGMVPYLPRTARADA